MNKVTVVIPYSIDDTLLQNAVTSVGKTFPVKTFSSSTVKMSDFSFSILKNEAIKKVATDWIFLLDSDEVVTPELKKNIQEVITEEGIDGFWIPRKTYISPTRYLKYGFFYPDYQLRLFRNKTDYKYQGRVHEYLPIPKNRTKSIQEPILHYPRNPKYVSFSNWKNLTFYIQLDANERIQSYLTQNTLHFLSMVNFVSFHIITGIYRFFRLFLEGFVRGKGFKDGWAGFRAHVLFSFSIAFSYWVAAWKLMKLYYGKK